MTLQDLVTKYTFDIDAKALDKVEDRIQGVTKFVTKMSLAATAAAGAVFAMVKTTANAGDEALALSQKVGVSVEKLTALEFAAKQSNVESGGLGVGLRFLSKNMVEAAKGSGDAAAVFRKFGISVKGANGQIAPTDEVLISLADKFKNMPNGAAKTAAAMEIFGRSGADLIPLLNEGSAGIQKMMNRADELGLTMSTELAQAGDTFNDTMDELMGSLTGIRNMVGAALLPMLTNLAKKITDWVVANRKLIATKLEEFMKTLWFFASGVYRIMQSLGRVISGLSRLFGGFDNILKLVIGSFLVLTAGNILIGIGALAMSLTNLGNMGLIAQAKLIAIPLAIGAAIALLGLIIEDIFTFFTDPEAETFTKDLINGIKSLWDALSGLFGEMGTWGKLIINVLLTPLRFVVNQFKNIADIINMFRGKQSFGETMSNIGSNLLNIVGGSGTGSGTLGEAFGFSPSSSPANTSTATDNSMQNQMQVVNNINVGAGADPTQVGKSVSQGTKDGLDSALRGAQRTFKKKGAY